MIMVIIGLWINFLSFFLIFWVKFVEFLFIVLRLLISGVEILLFGWMGMDMESLGLC